MSENTRGEYGREDGADCADEATLLKYFGDSKKSNLILQDLDEYNQEKLGSEPIESSEEDDLVINPLTLKNILASETTINESLHS